MNTDENSSDEVIDVVGSGKRYRLTSRGNSHTLGGKNKKKTAKSEESFSENLLAVSDESIIQESQSHLCFCCG